MSSESPKQARLIAWDLHRKKNGEATATGMSLGQLKEWHRQDEARGEMFKKQAEGK